MKLTWMKDGLEPRKSELEASHDSACLFYPDAPSVVHITSGHVVHLTSYIDCRILGDCNRQYSLVSMTCSRIVDENEIEL